jgi:hypothetical protein
MLACLFPSAVVTVNTDVPALNASKNTIFPF